MVDPSPSNALVRKRSNMELMPPPPPAKKIKRPKQILEEESYTDALSQIIARDFFPGLLETEIQREYMDALESKDQAWISSAGRRLRHVMTPGRRSTPAAKATFHGDGSQTPTTYVGDTPASEASTAPSRKRQMDTNMSLSQFQQTYTSEDNESFYKLLDRQNQKRADKYAWLWRGNKLPSKQMIKQKEVEDKLAETRSLVDDGHKKDRMAIKDKDDRPACPDTWRSTPRNGLMFATEGVEDESGSVAAQAAEASRMGPKAIVLENTRMPKPHIPKRPLSPTASSIRDAVAGKPRKRDQDSTIAGDETPKVNGYAFVDDEDDEESELTEACIIKLGPGDTHNPFKIQEQRDRETLHERMVDRIAKLNKESARNGLVGKMHKTPVPKFPSSPRVTTALTPAAQRLWSQMGNTPARSGGSSFGQSTPMAPRGSLLKSVTRPKPKPE